MKVLVTGANGFIGKHICKKLEAKSYIVYKYDLDSTEEQLVEYISSCDFVIHLAGINRPMSVEEFYDGNSNFTKKVADLLLKFNKNAPIIMSSSIQASLDNDYGKSKKMGEDYLLNSGLKVYVYRLANVFGKWCRPNYNSACATFCYNIAHNLDISIRDREYVVHFNYIDDIVNEFINIVEGGDPTQKDGDIYSVLPVHDCSLGRLADLLYYFKGEIESDRHLPAIHDDFELKLFKTFCDYLSDEGYSFNYSTDARGSFEELYKSKKWGQISENIAFPGITKGGHYHTYKKEIFMTVKGQCVIRQRNINNNHMLVANVDGKDSTKVDIIPYYTHEIKNVGASDSVTIMWISEIYSDFTPDTFREPVDK